MAHLLTWGANLATPYFNRSVRLCQWLQINPIPSPCHTRYSGFTGCGCSVLTHFLEWAYPGDDYLFGGGGLLTGAHPSLCQHRLVHQLLWPLWASCQLSTAEWEWLSLFPLIPHPLPCHVYFHDKSPKKDFQCVLTGWNCVIQLDLVKSPVANPPQHKARKACTLFTACLPSWGIAFTNSLLTFCPWPKGRRECTAYLHLQSPCVCSVKAFA